MPLRTAATLALSGMFLLSACPKGTPRHRPAPRLERGTPVDASFRGLDGKTVRLAHFRGKPLVIFFFTTWCVPCQVQVARIQPARAALGNDKVAVLGIAIDTQRRLVPPFVEAAGINFPVAYGDPSMVRGGPLGAVRGVPRILVLDARGRPVADHHRPLGTARLMRILKPLVR